MESIALSGKGVTVGQSKGYEGPRAVRTPDNKRESLTSSSGILSKVSGRQRPPTPSYLSGQPTCMMHAPAVELTVRTNSTGLPASKSQLVRISTGIPSPKRRVRKGDYCPDCHQACPLIVGGPGRSQGGRGGGGRKASNSCAGVPKNSPGPALRTIRRWYISVSAPPGVGWDGVNRVCYCFENLVTRYTAGSTSPDDFLKDHSAGMAA